MHLSVSCFDHMHLFSQAITSNCLNMSAPDWKKMEIFKVNLILMAKSLITKHHEKNGVCSWHLFSFCCISLLHPVSFMDPSSTFSGLIPSADGCMRRLGFFPNAL